MNIKLTLVILLGCVLSIGAQTYQVTLFPYAGSESVPVPDFDDYGEVLLYSDFEGQSLGDAYEADLATEFNQNGAVFQSYTRGTVDDSYTGWDADTTVSFVDVDANDYGDASRAMELEFNYWDEWNGSVNLMSLGGDDDNYTGDRVGGNGTKMLIDLPDSWADTIALSYNVLFKNTEDDGSPSDFQINGKLPSLEGGETRPDDFHASINFTGPLEDPFNNGSMTWYIRPEGESAGGNGPWREPGSTDSGSEFVYDVTEPRWYNMTIIIGMNNNGNADGFAVSYINGGLSGRWVDLEWESDDFHVDYVLLEYFYGGRSMGVAAGGTNPDFSPEGDQYFILDDLTIFTLDDWTDITTWGNWLDALPNWNIGAGLKIDYE